MEWAVLTWNESAINFYEKLGAKRLNDWYYYRLTEDSLKALSRLRHLSRIFLRFPYRRKSIRVFAIIPATKRRTVRKGYQVDDYAISLEGFSQTYNGKDYVVNDVSFR